METKDNTLESAILDVWKNAAENNMSGEDSFEIGTDRYRNHTETMTPGQVEEALEMSDEDFDNLLETLTAEELIALDEGLGDFIQKRTGLGFGGKAKRAAHLKKKAAKKMGKYQARVDIDKAKADIDRAKQKTKDYKAGKKHMKQLTKQHKKDQKQKKKDAWMADYQKKADAKTTGSATSDPKGNGQASTAVKTTPPTKGNGQAGTVVTKTKTKKKTDPRLAMGEYDPTVTESIKMNGQEQIKGLRETVLDMWKEAADTHVDPKEREELDGNDGVTGKGGVETAKKMKHAKEPKPMVATEALTAKQKKIDIDGDGEIEGSDLAKLRKGAKKEDAELPEGKMSQIDQMKKEGKSAEEIAQELKMDVGAVKRVIGEELTIPQAQEFKVASMKQALAQVWGLDEWKNTKENRRVDGGDKRRTESKKNGKTDTGGKMAEVEIDPELKEKNKK